MTPAMPGTKPQDDEASAGPAINRIELSPIFVECQALKGRVAVLEAQRDLAEEECVKLRTELAALRAERCTLSCERNRAVDAGAAAAKWLLEEGRT
jgi:hypothetical protein